MDSVLAAISLTACGVVLAALARRMLRSAPAERSSISRDDFRASLASSGVGADISENLVLALAAWKEDNARDIDPEDALEQTLGIVDEDLQDLIASIAGHIGIRDASRLDMRGFQIVTVRDLAIAMEAVRNAPHPPDASSRGEVT